MAVLLAFVVAVALSVLAVAFFSLILLCFVFVDMYVVVIVVVFCCYRMLCMSLIIAVLLCHSCWLNCWDCDGCCGLVFDVVVVAVILSLRCCCRCIRGAVFSVGGIAIHTSLHLSLSLFDTVACA